MDGRFFAGRQLKALWDSLSSVMCSFWDGHTDYRTKMTDDEENEKLEDFANWIEQDDSPVSSTNVKLLCTVEFTTLQQTPHFISHTGFFPDGSLRTLLASSALFVRVELISFISAFVFYASHVSPSPTIVVPLIVLISPPAARSPSSLPFMRSFSFAFSRL